MAELQTDLLIFLRRHRFEQSQLLRHHAQRQMHTPEKGHHTIRVLLLQILVDIEKSVGDQLHPQLFDLMDDLKLQLVPVAELIELFLALEQGFRVQVQLVIERAFAVHEGVIVLAVQLRLLILKSCRRANNIARMYCRRCEYRCRICGSKWRFPPSDCPGDGGSIPTHPDTSRRPAGNALRPSPAAGRRRSLPPAVDTKSHAARPDKHPRPPSKDDCGPASIARLPRPRPAPKIVHPDRRTANDAGRTANWIPSVPASAGADCAAAWVALRQPGRCSPPAGSPPVDRQIAGCSDALRLCSHPTTALRGFVCGPARSVQPSNAPPSLRRLLRLLLPAACIPPSLPDQFAKCRRESAVQHRRRVWKAYPQAADFPIP